MKNKEQLREEFYTKYTLLAYSEEVKHALECLWQHVEENYVPKDSIQECYLECLAVECGEGLCAEAIATKFPNYVTRLKDED